MNNDCPFEGHLLKITNLCNLNCRFCTINSKEHIPFKNIIKKANALPSNSKVVLCGGEPFINKEILSILRELKNSGLRLYIATNGRILFYKDLIYKISDFIEGLIITPLILSRSLYNIITDSDEGYIQSLRGIKNISNIEGLNLELRYPINRETIRHIKKIEDVIEQLGQKSRFYITFTYSPDIGRSINDDSIFDELINIPLLSAIKKNIYLEDFPLCVQNNSSISNNRFSTLLLDSPVCPFLKNTLHYKKAAICNDCVNTGSCKGVPENIFDDKIIRSLKPITTLKSNSFDYILIKDKIDVGEPLRNCKVYLNARFDNPERYLFLKRGNKTSLYYTDTDSFSKEDIIKTKLERQQIYIDISNKVRLDDFQKDIRLLTLNRVCSGCKFIERCAAFYEISDDIPFEREERWLRQEIRRLKGRVLDIGCGDMRFYKDIINGLLRSGRIDYYGIDIDQGALRRLKKDIPRAKVFRTSIEDFEFDEGYFDYIFSLRSLNHFYDIRRAFNNIYRLSKKYGMVIVAECVPFALLRDKNKVMQVRRSTNAVFEHYRNWDSEDLIRFIREYNYPFKIDTHKPVQAGTSNQWIVKLMKLLI